MAKKKIFISHISEESEIAKKFKEEILKYTNNGVEVFVSSDDESIYLGDDWEEEVKTNIRTCDMMLVLVSKNSLNRPWISFETGAAWVRGIKPIPICHGGMNTRELPKPFSIMQAVNTDGTDLTKVFKRISLLRDEDYISADVTELVKVIKEFDKKDYEKGFNKKGYEHDGIQEFLKLFDEHSKTVLRSLNENTNFTSTLEFERKEYEKLLDFKDHSDIGSLFTTNFIHDSLVYSGGRMIDRVRFDIILQPELVKKINK